MDDMCTAGVIYTYSFETWLFTSDMNSHMFFSLNSAKKPQQRLGKIIFSAMGTPQRARLLPENLEKMLGGNYKQKLLC